MRLADLEALRSSLFAEDVPIPRESGGWSEADATAYFESGGQCLPGGSVDQSGGGPATYRVVHTYVNVRAEPLMSAPTVGKKVNGEMVPADRCGGASDGWVRLVETFGGKRGWLLLDGGCVGLGPLLRLESGVPPPTEADARAAAGKEAGKEEGLGRATAATRAAPAPAAAAPRAATSGRLVELAAPMVYEVCHALVRIRATPDLGGTELSTRRKAHRRAL